MEQTNSVKDMLLEIYCDVDDFCKAFTEYWRAHLVTDGREILPQCAMSLSEIMTIVVYLHLSNQRTFKWYYKNLICEQLKDLFPRRLSYNRFVEVMQSAIVPLLVYTMKCRVGKCSGISFVDSTKLSVCGNKRISRNKVFENIAKVGKSTMGWFYGFKLHLTINDKGEILSFCITPGNVDDRNEAVISHLTKELFGKLFADKGYISSSLFERLWKDNIHLVTGIKKNMKNRLMDMSDKILLRKRSIIETVNDFLKNICQIEHTRHRSPVNFTVNLLAGIAAYSFLPQKPSLALCFPASLLA
jgi:IS5 family transposase